MAAQGASLRMMRSTGFLSRVVSQCTSPQRAGYGVSTPAAATGPSGALRRNLCSAPGTPGAATAPPLRFLVIDGYAKAGRDELRAGGVALGSELYERMLLKCSPKPAVVDVVFPDDDDFEADGPLDFDKYDGVAWTGSSLTVHTGEWSAENQIAFRKRQAKHPVPTFGSCWAVQVAACAAGGECAANPKGREMGLSRKITLTAEGRAHPMFEGKPTTFDAPTFHNDEITRLGEASRLAGNNWSQVQAIQVTGGDGGGVFWGVQYHPEYSLYDLATLIRSRTPKMVAEGFFLDEEGVQAYVDDLIALHKDPSRKDIAIRLGIDADMWDDRIRWVEVRNWIRKMVVPYHLMRHAGPGHSRL